MLLICTILPLRASLSAAGGSSKVLDSTEAPKTIYTVRLTELPGLAVREAVSFSQRVFTSTPRRSGGLAKEAG